MPLAYFLEPLVHPLRVALNGREHLLLAEVERDLLAAERPHDVADPLGIGTRLAERPK